MGLSLGEVIIIVAVGSWAFGPKELPKMGRALGRLTGRATGFIHKTRAQLFDFAEKAELNKVQEELQTTMYQLQTIRSELQRGINILDPSPVSNQGLIHTTGRSGPRLQKTTTTSDMDFVQGTKEIRSNDSTTSASPLKSKVHEEDATVPINSFQQQHRPERSPSFASSSDPNSYPFPILPVSAIDTGRVPKRTGATPSGSQILADALEEEHIARHAVTYLFPSKTEVSKKG